MSSRLRRFVLAACLFGLIAVSAEARLSIGESQFLTASSFAARDFKTWNTDIRIKQIDAKFPEALDDLRKMYPAKIARIQERLQERLHPDDEQALQAKIVRLEAKYACVLKELEFRDKNLVTRTPHHTVYYIDYTDGNDANDGLSTGQAWKTLNKYTTTTVRTAGDIAYVRANQTHTYNTADIVCDEDGTAAAFLEIIGCDAVTNDPWGDASDVKPIISFGAAAYNLYILTDDFWKFTRLDFRDSSVPGTVSINSANNVQFVNCNFQGNTAEYGYGLQTVLCNIFVNGCTFSLNTYASVFMTGVKGQFDSCIFNGGGGGSTNYGIDCQGGILYLNNCQFGQTTTHNWYDVQATYGGIIYHRNSIFAGSNSIINGGLIFAEDDDQVYQAHTITTDKGTISRDATVFRVGGATTSAKMAPTSNCGVNNPLILTPEYFLGGAFKILMDAADASTITIYIKGYGWTGFPTAAQLYAEASYYDSAAACTRTVLASTQVLTDNTTWTAFTMTIPATYPKRAGFVYVNVYLKKYEASSGVYVDIKPVVN